MTRDEWGDDEVYLFMRADILHIHNEKGDHVLRVFDGDILGNDWRVVA